MAILLLVLVSGLGEEEEKGEEAEATSPGLEGGEDEGGGGGGGGNVAAGAKNLGKEDWVGERKGLKAHFLGAVEAGGPVRGRTNSTAGSGDEGGLMGGGGGGVGKDGGASKLLRWVETVATSPPPSGEKLAPVGKASLSRALNVVAL